MHWFKTTQASGHATGGGPRAVCGFRDGSVSVADTAFRGLGGAGGCGGGGGGSSTGGRVSGHIGSGSGAIPWASKAGHVETVFSCEHRPGDPDTLATGSYGSSVKVWHVPTMDLKVRALLGLVLTVRLLVSPELNPRRLAGQNQPHGLGEISPRTYFHVTISSAPAACLWAAR